VRFEDASLKQREKELIKLVEKQEEQILDKNRNLSYLEIEVREKSIMLAKNA